MGVLQDAKFLVERYPLTFVALGAAAVVAAPVASVALAGALRPWAKRILFNAAALHGELRRIAAESKEAYRDLYAEAVDDAVAAPAPRAPSRPGVNSSARPPKTDLVQASSAPVS